MAVALYVLDKDGNAANVINGQAILGPLVGWKGLSFTPSGAAIDKVPQNRVSVPLSDWRNVAVNGGAAMITVYDSDLGDEITRGPIVGNVEITQDATGAFWAQITFADALFTLSRADVTSAFATAPNETLNQTGLRLVSLADTPWTFANSITGLDGIPFIAAGSVMQAFDKLRQERFGHFRRERIGNDPYVLRFGIFGDPVQANSGPLLITTPGTSPTHGAEAVTVRQLLNPRVENRVDVVNSITPTGGGSGTAQLTMRLIYGIGGWPGYQPEHPVLRRIQQAASTFDGYDYYIEDAPSVALYGRSRIQMAKPDINPVRNSAGGVSVVDETIAAQALYVVALNELLRSKGPTMQITFDTDPVHDPRNLGGLSVHVRYAGFAFDPTSRVYQFLDVDDDFIVLEIVRAIDDATGAARDTWTVSSSGEVAATAGGTLLGVMDTIAAMHVAVEALPMAVQYPKSQNIGPGTGGTNADLVLTIPADNSVVRMHWAILYLTLEGMVHTRADDGHTQDVITQATPLDVGNADNAPPVTHDVAALKVQLYGGGLPINEYRPNTTLHITSGTPPANAKRLMTNGTYFYWEGGGPDDDVSLFSSVLTIDSTSGTAATQGGTGGTVKATSGGTGGKTTQTRHNASSNVGAVKTVATTESVYRGPAPTGVTVLVDGVQVGGPFNTNPPALDISNYLNDRSRAHTVRVRSPTNGAADVVVDLRMDVTPLAVKPTGA